MTDTFPMFPAWLPSGILAVLIQGGPVMVPLLLSSLISLTVILERWRFWRRLRREEVTATILADVADGQLARALKVAQESSHPMARVLHAGLAYRRHAPGLAMEAAAQAELQRAKAYLGILDTIITLAPLLGLLGTITGMISAFGIVSATGLGQPNAITGGIAEALIATATGLFVAIMTLLPYNYFRARVEHFTERMEEQATRLELLLTHQET